MKKIIIAGFPGIGKSYFATKTMPAAVTLPGGTISAGIFPTAIDLDSSVFHWITVKDSSGNFKKIQHPEWPENYIKAIRAMTYESDYIPEYSQVKYVFCSTHKHVLEALKGRQEAFIIVAPETKEIFLQRYKDRGSSEEFIKQLDDNWNSYMHDLETIGMPLITTDGYLSDILERESTYKYFLDKIDNINTHMFGLDTNGVEDDVY